MNLLNSILNDFQQHFKWNINHNQGAINTLFKGTTVAYSLNSLIRNQLQSSHEETNIAFAKSLVDNKNTQQITVSSPEIVIVVN